jgi:hypothetical protein
MLVTIVAVAVTTLLTVVVTWWQAPVDRIDRGLFVHFDQRDAVPAAYAAFGVTLGVLAGVLVRRTIAAMAATIAAFALLRYLFEQYVRPNLLTSQHVRSPFRAPMIDGSGIGASLRPPNANDWVLSNQVVTSSGRIVGENGGIGPNGSFNFSVAPNGSAVLSGVGPCPGRIPLPPGGIRGHMTPAQDHAAQAAIQQCVNSFHLSSVLTYQPVAHFWPMQWYEAGCFLVAAALLGASSMWFVSRRLS